jgi:catalase
MAGQAERILARTPTDRLELSPALSIVQKAPRTLEGRTGTVLVSDGSDGTLVEALRVATEKGGARFALVGAEDRWRRRGGRRTHRRRPCLTAAPSVFFDAVVLTPSANGARLLAQEAAAVGWRRDASDI